MPSTQEVMQRAKQVRERVAAVCDVLPTQQNLGHDYQDAVLHAGADTLHVIDQLGRGEAPLRPLFQSKERFQKYLQQLTEQSAAANPVGEYVVITVDQHQFLGVARLVKRPLSMAELRQIYRIPTTMTDQQIMDARAGGQLPLSEDLGLHVSFTSFPLQAIREVQSIGTNDARLAAHTAATSVVVAEKSLQVTQDTMMAGCHDHDPNFTAGNPHFMTPIAIALAAATTPAELDRVITATTATTAIAHGNLNPTLAEVLHLHHLPNEAAARQTTAIGQTGLVGGKETFTLAFWLHGWDGQVAGQNQPALRQRFQVAALEQAQLQLLHTGANDFSATEQLELTVVTGTALTAPSTDRLQRQIARVGDRRQLFQSVVTVFKGE